MRRGTVIALLAYLLLRWVLATDPGYYYDVQLYKNWALFAARDGISEVYTQRSGMDYPPLYAYILYPLGKIYLAAVPEAAARLGTEIVDSTTLTVLVKIPCLLFDLCIAGLLALWVRRQPAGHLLSDRWTRWLPWLYLLNPAILFNGAYWGQPDAIHSAFVLAAFLTLHWARSAWPAWVLLTLGTLMKPLGAPFFPLLAVASFVRHGFRSTLVGGLAALAAAGVVFAPFLATGRMGETWDRVVGDLGAMAYTSTNAHNLWWLLGGWKNAEVPWLGPFTATHVGLFLFGAFYLGVLLTGHRLHGAGWSLRALVPRRGTAGGITHAQIVALALLVGLGFFMLSTHMHENHMFLSIPLLLPLTALRGPRSAWTRVLFVAVTAGVFANLALHDLDVGETARPKWAWLAAGGPSGEMNQHLNRPFFVAELWAVRASLWWNLILFAVLAVESFRPRGWLAQLGPGPSPGSGENAKPEERATVE